MQGEQSRIAELHRINPGFTATRLQEIMRKFQGLHSPTGKFSQKLKKLNLVATEKLAVTTCRITFSNIEVSRKLGNNRLGTPEIAVGKCLAVYDKDASSRAAHVTHTQHKEGICRLPIFTVNVIGQFVRSWVADPPPRTII